MKRYGSPQGLARWLANEKFEAWRPAETRAAAPSAPSSVPAALRTAVILRKGAAWAASWFAPCRYDALARMLYAKSAFAAKRIASELGGLLRDLDISLAPTRTS